jgi:hypothetical protein
MGRSTLALKGSGARSLEGLEGKHIKTPIKNDFAFPNEVCRGTPRLFRDPDSLKEFIAKIP